MQCLTTNIRTNMLTNTFDAIESGATKLLITDLIGQRIYIALTPLKQLCKIYSFLSIFTLLKIRGDLSGANMDLS